MSTGRMHFKDKSIPVRDAVREPRLDETGVRDGWMATTDDVIASRMFYPADMFIFRPATPPKNREEQRNG